MWGIVKKLDNKLESLILKIKDILKDESSKTKEMLSIYEDFIKGKAQDNEIKQANKQLKNLIKTVGFGGYLILPLSLLTLPTLKFLCERYNINIFPTWFIDNKEKDPSK